MTSKLSNRFTSGSTGKPKGVMIEHCSISNLVQHSQPYGYHRGARVLSSLAYTFDPFAVDVFGTLSCGATLVTGRKELVLGDIGSAVKNLRVNVVHCTPSILAVVPLDPYPTLETVVVAGEALGKRLIEDWSKRVKFMNMYGPTEASVDYLHTHVTDVSLTGVIGRPLPNNRLYILDENLRPTPIGVEGELFIGGVQLACGYLNQPGQTEKAFIPNPFVPGKRVYRTGDIAMFRTDGKIVYCGRKDRQSSFVVNVSSSVRSRMSSTNTNPSSVALSSFETSTMPPPWSFSSNSSLPPPMITLLTRRRLSRCTSRSAL